MNRGRKMLELALLDTVCNRRPAQENSDILVATVSKMSCSINTAQNSVPFNGEETECFVPVVANETHSSFLYGFSPIINVTNLKRDLQLMSDAMDSFDEDSDDSVKDPDFYAMDESFSDSDIVQMASQMEYNIVHEQPEINMEEINIDCDQCGSLEKQSQKLRKQNRNLGKTYKTKTGKVVAERVMKKLTVCRRKCMNKILPNDQEIIFKQYWQLGNFNLRLAFVSGLITVDEKKTARLNKSIKAPRNRQFSYSYFLQIQGVRTQVCQKCFKITLGETDRFLKTVIKKKIESPGTVIAGDLRGKSVPPNKISANQINIIHEHINSIPAYESHYTRNYSAQRYFESNLNHSILYKLYTQKTEKPVSMSKYSEIFKSLNIKFKKPKLDTCTKCDTLAIKKGVAAGTDLENIEEEQKQHNADADSAYESKRNDVETARQDPTTKVFTFDLQQCLPTPYLQSSVSFYKRQLYTFNLTIHDCAEGTPHCYMWHEGIANRGGNEVASCLFEHLKSLSPNIKNVVYYSDNCFGQNKNKIVAAMLIIFISAEYNANTALEYIDHKFLVPGHTHMECDIDHSIIERKKKKSSVKIHHPRDWYQFIRGIGCKNKFMVHEMSQQTIWNFASIVKNKFNFRKVNEDSGKVNWKNIRWLRYLKAIPTVIYYKNSLDDNEGFKCLNIKKRGFNEVNENNLELLFNSPNLISEAKKKDLVTLLPLIDEQFHDFYRSLSTGNKPDFHPDITAEDAEAD